MSGLISVVVCTYNRADLLPDALQSLCEQTLDRAFYEVIVVDNNSTDNTRAVAEDFCCRYPNIRYCLETQQGLSHARNRGWREARGEYIAYLDDDARAQADWLKVVRECFECAPFPQVVGGPILPFYDSPKPAWFKDEYEIRTWGDQPRLLKRGESFSGSNMILKKEGLEVCGGFDVRVGVRGEYLSVGEETALFDNIWQVHGSAAVLYYLPQLIVYHAVPAQKMTVAYHLKRAFATGQAWNLRYGPRPLSRRLRQLASILVSVVRQSGSALVHAREYPAYPNWIIERLAPIVCEMGRWVGCLGLAVSVRQR